MNPLLDELDSPFSSQSDVEFEGFLDEMHSRDEAARDEKEMDEKEMRKLNG
jgi:hypothetical protein